MQRFTRIVLLWALTFSEGIASLVFAEYVGINNNSTAAIRRELDAVDVRIAIMKVIRADRRGLGIEVYQDAASSLEFAAAGGVGRQERAITMEKGHPDLQAGIVGYVRLRMAGCSAWFSVSVLSAIIEARETTKLRDWESQESVWRILRRRHEVGVPKDVRQLIADSLERATEEIAFLADGDILRVIGLRDGDRIDYLLGVDRRVVCEPELFSLYFAKMHRIAGGFGVRDQLCVTEVNRRFNINLVASVQMSDPLLTTPEIAVMLGL